MKPDFIKPMSDVKYKMSVIIYGPPGAGKTPLAAAMANSPQLAPTLFVIADKGTRSIADRSFDVAEVASWDAVKVLVEWLAKGEHDYRSIVIDPISKIYTWILEDAMINRKKGDNEVLELRDYGIALYKIQKLVVLLKSFDLHLIVIALEQTFEVKHINVLKPMLAGQAADRVPAEFDVVMRLYTGKDSEGIPAQLLRTRGTSTVMARDRSMSLDDVITQPDGDTLVKTILAQLSEGR